MSFAKPALSNKPGGNLDYILLLFTLHFEVGSEVVISNYQNWTVKWCLPALRYSMHPYLPSWITFHNLKPPESCPKTCAQCTFFCVFFYDLHPHRNPLIEKLSSHAVQKYPRNPYRIGLSGDIRTIVYQTFIVYWHAYWATMILYTSPWGRH